MANYPKTYSEISDDFLLEDEVDEMPTSQPTKSASAGSDSAPITTEVLTTLLAGLQNTTLVDKAKICEDLKGLSNRITNTGEQALQITSLQRRKVKHMTNTLQMWKTRGAEQM
ncbi:Hypothetical predicted protein [Pelobates cultripes]|uniref:Uncharacterized protein n=1 Tax=Pelobates cultripes TaxID=61616 RepID=A0AAD1QZC8_PELCU|nr:Hypothetical predicted protein [Pelobates cultripes]